MKGLQLCRWTHLCSEHILYIFYAVLDSTPNNAAIFKTEHGLNVILRPQRCFNAETTFLSVCVWCISALLFHSCTYFVHPQILMTHSCWGQILISLSDTLVALHPKGLVSYIRWYRMTNPTLYVFCLFCSVCFLYLIVLLKVLNVATHTHKECVRLWVLLCILCL